MNDEEANNRVDYYSEKENFDDEVKRFQNFAIFILAFLMLIEIICVIAIGNSRVQDLPFTNPDVEIMKAQSKMFGH